MLVLKQNNIILIFHLEIFYCIFYFFISVGIYYGLLRIQDIFRHYLFTAENDNYVFSIHPNFRNPIVVLPLLIRVS